ncbi:MAG: methyltransferase [Deltaproteobacteria bacterium]|nr:MAG: methyltransferase [Deltaproteobacteria bacterium]
MVETTLNYLAPMAERPYYYTYPPPAGVPGRNTHGDRRRVTVRDARALAHPSLDVEGFALVPLVSALADAYDPDAVRRAYYPEVEALVRRTTGAHRVLAFDHNVRNTDRDAAESDLSQGPVRYVHNDYTQRSGPQRVRDLVGGDEADTLLQRRFAVINVWRPIRGPVEQAPLAFCDASSLAQRDFVPTDLRYRDRVGEVYSLTYRPEHRWFYYPGMRADEALLLKCYDSDPRFACFTAHTAIDDPTSPAGATPRESIEVRTLAFF